MMSGSSQETNRLYIDPSDPLFLHPSDHPGMMLVSKPFDGTSFGAWKRSIAIALSAKNKMQFVTGQIAKPRDGEQLRNTWQRCNDMVTSWLLNALTPEIAESVLYAEDASKIWRELEDRFGQVNGAKLYQLQKEISTIEQSNSDIASYYTRFKKICDEFSSLRTLPSCVCGSSQSLQKYEEEQKLIQFLMGLNAQYNGVRGNILMMKPLPTLNQAYAILVQEEQQREVHNTTRFVVDSAAMNTTTRHNAQSGSKFYNEGRNNFEGKKAFVCHHCKKPGHIASQCYRLIGFPKDFKFTRGKRVAAGAMSYGDENQQPGTSEEAAVHKSFDMSREEYDQLLKLLNRVNIQDKGAEKDILSTHSANFAGPFNEGANGAW